MKTTKGLYIHIPFCLSKCTYCDFYSVAIDTEIMNSYVDALVDEIRLSGLKNEETILDSIYIGGGTPSVLPPSFLEKIVLAIHNSFSLNLKEFSIEVNPATNINLKNYRDLGIDRVSLGVQTLNDKLLKIIGRRHDSTLALKTIDEANKYFDKVSCDLMIGLPTQTNFDVETSAKTLSSKVKHISMYMLKLSNNVKMANQVRNGDFCLPNDDDTVDQYEIAYDIFKNNGLYRYEISNFSAPQYESYHNLKYWNREQYIGLGASAHGFVNNERYYNPSNIKEYIAGKNYGHGKEFKEFVSESEALFETIMLALRMPKGIDISSINRDFNIDFEEKYREQLNYLKPFLQNVDNHISIKEDKLLLESAIVREFII